MDGAIDVTAGIINHVGPRRQAEPAHHLPVIKKRKQRLRVAGAPGTQDEPLGLNLGLERVAHLLTAGFDPMRTSQVYWITSSAVARSVSGMVRPSALAVFILITSSNFVGRCTGKSAGFSPRRMRSI
jgi:hypothetical protein